LTSQQSAKHRPGDAKLLVEGRSGCHLRLITEGSSTLLRKFSKDAKYSARLVKQANKQRAFARFSVGGDFRVPAVLNVFEGDKRQDAFVDMEFVHAEKYSDFLGAVSSTRLKRLADSILDYFDRLIDGARPISIRQEVLIEKLDAVAGAIDLDRVDCPLVESAFDYLRVPPEGTILLGRCHGDFTLSNMLFQSERVYLIDFLDAFVETPCQDIVKLRQDTYFHWSLMLEPMLPTHQRNRVLQTLQYIDRRVQHWMRTQESVCRWYDYLQTFNLFRILPYVSADHEIHFVQQALKHQLNHAAHHSNGRQVDTFSGGQTKVDADASGRAFHGRPSDSRPESARL